MQVSMLKNRMFSTASLLILLSAAVFAFLVLFPDRGGAEAGADTDDLRFYTVDTLAVMESHPAFQEAMEQYQERMQELQQQIEGMGEQEQAMMQHVFQQQVQQIGAELQEEAFDKMQEDINRYAEEKGYKYIFDANVMLVGGTDITDDIIDEIGVEPLDMEVQQPPAPEELPIMP